MDLIQFLKTICILTGSSVTNLCTWGGNKKWTSQSTVG